MKYVKIPVYFEPLLPGQYVGALGVSVENGQKMSIPLEATAL